MNCTPDISCRTCETDWPAVFGGAGNLPGAQTSVRHSCPHFTLFLGQRRAQAYKVFADDPDHHDALNRIGNSNQVTTLWHFRPSAYRGFCPKFEVCFVPPLGVTS